MANERFIPLDTSKDGLRDPILQASREDRLVLKSSLEPLQEMPLLMQGETISYVFTLRGNDKKLIEGRPPSSNAKFSIEFRDRTQGKSTWTNATLKSFRTYPDGSTTVVFVTGEKTHIFRVELPQGKVAYRFKNQPVKSTK